MKKLFFFSIAIAVLAAFFASTHPDGLDFVAEKFGFAAKATGHSAPLADYRVGFLPAGGISTLVAGIAGILITLSIFCYLLQFAMFEIHRTLGSSIRKNNQKEKGREIVSHPAESYGANNPKR